MRTLAIIGLSALALTISACGEKAAEPTGGASEAAANGPESAPGVAVTDAMIRLPAVPGTPGAAYFTVSQGSGAPRKVVSIYVEGVGRAEMHETVTEGGISKMQQVKNVPLEAGKSVEFKPGGMHVMLFEVADTLKAGTNSELTVTLDSGDKVSVPARVETLAGSDMTDHDMSGHDMSKM